MKAREALARTGGTAAMSGIVVLAAAGAATAAWASVAAGEVTVSSAAPVELHASADVVAVGGSMLYPGASATLRLRVSNPNPYPVVVTRLAPSGVVTASNSSGTCRSDSLAVATSDVQWQLDAQSSITVDVPAGASMSPEADNGCQGARFTVGVLLTGVTR